MRDELNIRELYNNLIEERAAANGFVVLENVTIPRGNSDPDHTDFDGVELPFDHSNAKTFSFIGGGGGVLVHSDNPHTYIFNGLKATKNPMYGVNALKEYGVKSCGKLSEDDIEYFLDKQRHSAMGDTRIATRSGRIWRKIKSKKTDRPVSVVSFWCRQKDVSEEELKTIKKCFKSEEIFWAASDSKNFNHYGDSHRDTPDGEIKELKSKIAPDLSHDDIVDILMRAHTGYKITPYEKKIVWEFRGHDPSEIKQVTGGYPTRAEYEYRSRFSEENEK